MAFKLIVLFASLALAAASPTFLTTNLKAEVEHEPNYSFGYDIRDPSTGDFKNQFETRKGDVVQGRYSLLEADGSQRTVNYAADALSGFNAVVSKTEPVVATAKIATPVVREAIPAISSARIEVDPFLYSGRIATHLISNPSVARIDFAPFTSSLGLLGHGGSLGEFIY